VLSPLQLSGAGVTLRGHSGTLARAAPLLQRVVRGTQAV
jgi:hypothetical protein